MYEIFDMEQGTQEWIDIRLGKITASNFDKVVTKVGKPSVSSQSLVNKAVAQLIIGDSEESFTNDTMQRGTDMEGEAFDFVNLILGYEFSKVGFLDSGLGYGCSPDGFNTEHNMGLELKCPLAHTHVGYLAAGTLPKQYFHQVQGSLLVSGFNKWVFVSYHPQFPALELVVERDEKFISQLEQELLKSCEKIKEKYKIILDKMI